MHTHTPSLHNIITSQSRHNWQPTVSSAQVTGLLSEGLDHVVPFKVVAELTVIVPRAYARYDRQLERAMLTPGNPLSLSHQQGTVPLQFNVQLSKCNHDACCKGTAYQCVLSGLMELEHHLG